MFNSAQTRPATKADLINKVFEGLSFSYNDADKFRIAFGTLRDGTFASVATDMDIGSDSDVTKQNVETHGNETKRVRQTPRGFQYAQSVGLANYTYYTFRKNSLGGIIVCMQGEDIYNGGAEPDYKSYMYLYSPTPLR